MRTCGEIDSDYISQKPHSWRWACRQWRDIIQNTNQMKTTPAYNFVAILEKVLSLEKPFIASTIDTVLGSSPSQTGDAKTWQTKFSKSFAKSHRFYSFTSSVAPSFLIMNHLLYLLSTKSHRKKLSFLKQFLSSCHRIPEVVARGRAYGNIRWGWT